jgi:hypothetical protein
MPPKADQAVVVMSNVCVRQNTFYVGCGVVAWMELEIVPKHRDAEAIL